MNQRNIIQDWLIANWEIWWMAIYKYKSFAIHKRPVGWICSWFTNLQSLPRDTVTPTNWTFAHPNNSNNTLLFSNKSPSWSFSSWSWPWLVSSPLPTQTQHPPRFLAFSRDERRAPSTVVGTYLNHGWVIKSSHWNLSIYILIVDFRCWFPLAKTLQFPKDVFLTPRSYRNGQYLVLLQMALRSWNNEEASASLTVEVASKSLVLKTLRSSFATTTTSALSQIAII